jgi:hypothetical protein
MVSRLYGIWSLAVNVGSRAWATQAETYSNYIGSVKIARFLLPAVSLLIGSEKEDGVRESALFFASIPFSSPICQGFPQGYSDCSR